MPKKHRKLIKKYFNSLAKEFIKDPQHQNYEIFFEDFFDSRIQGQTRRTRTKTTNGKEYAYEIQFLGSGYKNEEDLRSTVVHEFTHLYLFSTIGKHDHGSGFYSKMYYFEDWLNENQGLIPRNEENKKHDKDQEIDIHEELVDLERKLVKHKKKIKKLKEELNQKCDQCHNQLGNSYFYHKSKSDGKRLCSDECYSLFYAEVCDKCNSKISKNDKSYYADSERKTGILCESCWKNKSNTTKCENNFRFLNLNFLADEEFQVNFHSLNHVPNNGKNT